MAIKLKNSMFIHVPKSGGRTIKEMLKKYVAGAEVVGDDIYDSHATPDTDLQVFGFIRHLATFIHSLWTHRSKKKAHGDSWNWQNHLRLERVCKSENLNTILKQNNEDFDEKSIRKNIYVHGANNKQKGKPVSVNESMTYDQIKRLVTESEQELCRKFDYHAF